jgi:DNA mismatch repair ATPase MutS
LKELEQGKETLIAAGKEAFLDWQARISQHYDTLREATLSLATFDCLMSMAKVAIGSGSEYCRPSFVREGRLLDLRDVRHPMVSWLSIDCERSRRLILVNECAVRSSYGRLCRQRYQVLGRNITTRYPNRTKYGR